MSKSTLAERAVLMRLSIGLPGESRKDHELTGEVKQEHGLGQDAGKWLKDLFPKAALEPIKKLDNKARAFHAAVTLPWDNGVGILPAALIVEYGNRMRDFKALRDGLVDSHFLARFDEWVQWARLAHNGTFDESLYDKAQAKEKFQFTYQPVPIPGSEHFSESVAQLLGVDTQSVDRQVGDAFVEGQRELLRRLIAPVKAMADKLKDSEAIFRDSLVGNVREIVELAPKLNIAGDPRIDAFVKEIEFKLAGPECTPNQLRASNALRGCVAKDAGDILTRLSGYQL